MSYANRKQLEQNRTLSIIFSAAITFIIGFALISGLASSFVKKAAADLKTFDVEQEPPPPEEPPPPPDKMPPPPEISSPPVNVRLQLQSPMTVPQTPLTPSPPTQTYIPAPPAPPAPPPPRITPPTSASGDLQGLISNDDYPPSAIDANQQGATAVVLTIGTNGRVSDCSIASSSGSRALDSTTCRILKAKAKFTPAHDSTGNPTTGTFRKTIRWVLAG